MHFWCTLKRLFFQIMSKGPKSTSIIWYLHAVPHDFGIVSDSNYSSYYRKILATVFGHLGIIALWLSGLIFSGVCLSSFQLWILDYLHITPCSNVLWTRFG